MNNDNNTKPSLINQLFDPTLSIFKSGGKLLLARVLGCIGFVIVLIILIFIGSFIFKYMFAQTKNNITEGLGVQNESEKNQKKFDDPGDLNKPIIVGKIEWKLLEAKIIESFPNTDEQYCKSADGYKFIYTKYSIRNVDRSFVTVPKDPVKLYDKDMTEYPSSSKLSKCLNENPDLKDKFIPNILQRDEKVELESLFEVPHESNGFRLKVGDLSVTGKDINYIGLGF